MPTSFHYVLSHSAPFFGKEGEEGRERNEGAKGTGQPDILGRWNSWQATVILGWR